MTEIRTQISEDLDNAVEKWRKEKGFSKKGAIVNILTEKMARSGYLKKETK